MKSFNTLKGRLGEDIACKYLEKNGYKVIERNKNFSRYCEIDIIALYKRTLVFVEVKTRKNNDFGAPLEAITKTKFKNIKQGLMMYLNECTVNYENYRIDAIGITLEPEIKISHLQNIFF